MQTQLINFTIPKKLLRKIDSFAKKEARSRSELLREAVKTYVESEKARRRSFEIIRAAAKRNNMPEGEAMRLVDEIRDQLPMNQ